MSWLRHVWVWPATGFADRVWGDSLEADSFLRTSRRVCEALSEALGLAGVEARHSEIRLRVTAELLEHDLVYSVVEHEFSEGFEMGHVQLPKDFHTLAPEQRITPVASAVLGCVRRLAEVRGWNADAIEGAIEQVAGSGYVYSWTGPWKSSPDRRTRVRLIADLEDSGFFTLRCEFEEPNRPGAGRRSESFVGESTTRGLLRHAKSLRWLSPETVELARHVLIAPGKLVPEDVRVDAVSGALLSTPVGRFPRANSGNPAAAIPVPKTLLLEPKELELGSAGGPMNGVPEAYWKQVDLMLARVLDSTEWRAWWEGAGVKEVWLPFHFEVPAAGLLVRVTRDKIYGAIRRPAESIPPGKAAAALAREDVQRLLKRIQARTGLGKHPAI